MSSQRDDASPPFDYSKASGYCDVVMKGGITSGVVYPLAACQFASCYHLKNIGGNSAGAIAASAAAAAEHRRRNGSTDGYKILETLPGLLGEPGRLPSLFRADKPAQRLFKVLMASQASESTAGKVFAALGAAVRGFPLAGVAGVSPGLLLGAALVIAWHNGGLHAWLAIPGLLFASVFVVLGLAIALAIRLTQRVGALPENFYGMCRGVADAPCGEQPTLTNWLTELLDQIAGTASRDEPLTFGDLWTCPTPPNTPPVPPASDDEDRSLGIGRSINLEMVTTCLTFGKPFQLPWRVEVFYFSPCQFRLLFPDRIVDHMVASVAGRPTLKANDGQEILPFPAAKDLPVVVATRMSLSFPLLLSAVPLYACERRSTPTKDGTAQSKPASAVYEQVWFSDGGICSNFPIHFFDRLVPRWPTFGLNLRPFRKGCQPDETTTETEKVRVAVSNGGGIQEWWTRFTEDTEGLELPPLSRVGGFLGAILNAMQNWRDNAQLSVPGYRDRVAHVQHTKVEGGLNLVMPEKRIASLSERGRIGADLLASRFKSPAAADNQLSWDNHCWIRYRSAMVLLEDCLASLQAGIGQAVEGQQSIRDLIKRGRDEFPKSYRWKESNPREQNAMPQQEFAEWATNALLALQREWEAKGTFRDPPRPEPELRVTPRMGGWTSQPRGNRGHDQETAENDE